MICRFRKKVSFSLVDGGRLYVLRGEIEIEFRGVLYFLK